MLINFFRRIADTFTSERVISIRAKRRVGNEKIKKENFKTLKAVIFPRIINAGRVISLCSTGTDYKHKLAYNMIRDIMTLHSLKN